MDGSDRVLEPKKPGLTCKEIARRLNEPEDEVRQCLGYAPIKSLVAYTEPPEWFWLRCR